MAAHNTILIIHDNPDLYLQSLTSQFPDSTIQVARNDLELSEKMAGQQPEILFSMRCDGISSKAQTAAAQKSCVKWIQVAGAGFDHIGDLDRLACKITTCAGVLSKFQAETVMGAMLNLNFGFFRYQQQQQKQIYRKLPWRSLEGQKLLLIGFGHIGRAVAIKARQFGMHITAIRSRLVDTPDADAVCTSDKLLSLLPETDFVSLHLPYNEKTHHFFSLEMLRAMKKSAYLINTARGGVIDEDALITALQEEQIAGAYIDVFNEEPLSQENPLWQLDNLLISPHYCDAVEDWQERFAAFFADNLHKWLAGNALQNVIRE